jgi:hypothetical protein
MIHRLLLLAVVVLTSALAPPPVAAQGSVTIPAMRLDVDQTNVNSSANRQAWREYLLGLIASGELEPPHLVTIVGSGGSFVEFTIDDDGQMFLTRSGPPGSRQGLPPESGGGGDPGGSPSGGPSHWLIRLVSYSAWTFSCYIGSVPCDPE